MPEEEMGVDNSSVGSQDDQLRMLEGLAKSSAPLYESNSVTNRREEESLVPPVVPPAPVENANDGITLGGDAENSNVEAPKAPEANASEEVEDKPVEGEADAESKEEDKKPATNESIDADLFGAEENKENTPPANEELAKTFESIAPLLKEHGIEDPNTLPDVLKDYKVQKEEATKLNTELNGVVQALESLDPDLIEAMKLNEQGEDWRGRLGIKGVNFSSNLDKIEDRTLVDHFLPNQISNEDWEEYSSEDCDPNLKRFIDQSLSTAKEKFTNEKTRRESQSADMVLQAKKTQELIDQSRETSIANMKQRFPRADDNYIKEVSALATPENVLKMFFNDDYSLKEDAITKITMAQKGTGLVDSYEARLKREIETELNQEILSRGADIPRSAATGSSPSTAEVSADVQKELDRLQRMAESSGPKY
tara:strand:- start:8700 stop:9971 length:1272 start_codon:yes stop_codon:yes gene_type:complete